MTGAVKVPTLRLPPWSNTSVHVAVPEIRSIFVFTAMLFMAAAKYALNAGWRGLVTAPDVSILSASVPELIEKLKIR